jgi:bifunctional DNase/RNase
MNMVQVQIDGLAMDVVSNSPVVVLASKEMNKVLPIWIGHNEAMAIAMEISGLGSKRPLTHDLFKNVIMAMGGQLDKVEVTELKEQTFYARIHVSVNGKNINIDARPSDSIALALKAQCPIYVNEELFSIKEEEAPEQMPPTDPESLADRLKRIDPEDFGKYSL